MLARFFTRPALVACLVAILATTVAVAAKPKGFPTYKQCVSKTSCSAQASSDPNGRNLNLTFIKVKCPVFQSVLGGQAWGAIQPNRKTGKFSIKNDVQAQSQKDMKYYVVHVKVTGTARLKKSITGSYTATTDAPDCTPATQKPTKFKLKFAGLAFGG